MFVRVSTAVNVRVSTAKRFAKNWTMRILSGGPVALVAFAGVNWIFDNVGYVACVEGGSMQPVLNPLWPKYDWVFLSCFAVRNYDVKRGDVVTIISPHDPKELFIKRVMGLQGDIVETLNYRRKHVRVPKGHCWLEGDNHKKSIDSNDFGPVPLALVQSKAIGIVWPWERRQFLEHEVDVATGAERVTTKEDLEKFIP